MPTQPEPIDIEAIPLVALVLNVYSRIALSCIAGGVALLRRSGRPATTTTVPRVSRNSRSSHPVTNRCS